MGKWKGGVLQILEDDKWINCDWSIIYHIPQHLQRLSSEDWDALKDTGFPVDMVWEQRMTNQHESDDESHLAKDERKTVSRHARH